MVEGRHQTTAGTAVLDWACHLPPWPATLLLIESAKAEATSSDNDGRTGNEQVPSSRIFRRPRPHSAPSAGDNNVQPVNIVIGG